MSSRVPVAYSYDNVKITLVQYYKKDSSQVSGKRAVLKLKKYNQTYSYSSFELVEIFFDMFVFLFQPTANGFFFWFFFTFFFFIPLVLLPWLITLFAIFGAILAWKTSSSSGSRSHKSPVGCLALSDNFCSIFWRYFNPVCWLNKRRYYKNDNSFRWQEKGKSAEISNRVWCNVIWILP